MPIHQYLDREADTGPDELYVLEGQRQLTYKETFQKANQIARALAACGLKPADRIAVLAKNCLEYALVYHGCSKAGVVPVPLNHRLAGPEWLYILNDSESRLLICAVEFCAAIDKLRSQLASTARFIAIGAPIPADWQSFDDWFDGASMEAPAHRPLEEEPALQLYTSGTTGRPKGSVLSHRAFHANFRFVANEFLQRHDRLLVVVPMYHIFGAATTFFATCVRGSLDIVSDFTPGGVVHKLSRQGIHFVSLVPAMIQACLTQVPGLSGRSFGNLRLIAYGGSAIAEQTLRDATESFQCEFLQLYGMTEIAPLTCLLPADHERALREQPALLQSAGKLLPGFDLRIVGANGQPAETGQVGEVVARGPALMTEYWKKPEATAEAMRGGWMHTGDAGCVDGEGYLYLQDRVSDMIVSGGENIYPREVEAVLFAHPDIIDSAVIGVPDEKWGETVKAIVVLRDGATATGEQIADFCRGKLAAYKRPRSVEFLAELPRNPSGKVLKRQLREPYWRGRRRRVAGS